MSGLYRLCETYHRVRSARSVYDEAGVTWSRSSLSSCRRCYPGFSWLWLDDTEPGIAVDSRRWLLVTGVRKSSLVGLSTSSLSPSFCAIFCGVLFRLWLPGSLGDASSGVLAIARSAVVRSGLPSDGNKLDGENRVRDSGCPPVDSSAHSSKRQLVVTFTERPQNMQTRNQRQYEA